MKTIGIIGGLTWLSTIDYYRLINQAINDKTSGTQSARIILYSLNFGDLLPFLQTHNWDGITNILCDAARDIEKAGAECILIATNTMHKVAGEVQLSVNIPLIHIAEATADTIKDQRLTKVALLGTKYTMQLDFYRRKLAEKNITTIIPPSEDIEFINDSIFNEIGRGILMPETKQRYISIFNTLKTEGAQGIILGCTEIPILIKQEDSPLPVFDTTAIHAKAAVDFALRN